jgi:RNA polymerase sigma-70 factor (ECF subfamily)
MATLVHWQRANQSIVAASDEIDWEQVYHEELPRVFNFFRYRVGADAAEDLTATTFEKAWRGREHYQRERAAFSTWLFTIARHVAADHLRRHPDREAVSFDDLREQSPLLSLPEVVEQHDEFARLTALLAKLPPRERELLSLKYGADLTNRAIAKVMGLSESNVGTILHRTIMELRAQWET